MVKNCYVVECHNTFKKEIGTHFYRFPGDPEKHSKWIVAVKCEKWSLNVNSWICSTHLVTGQKSSNPLAANYVPSLFPQPAK